MIDKLILNDIISGKADRPLFIFEMANNHMGDVEHGLKIIRDFYEVSKDYNFYFAFKFQFRNIETFIHPDFKNNPEHKYVKRFQETALSREQFMVLKNEAEKLGFITICTPFDEPSVAQIEDMGFDVLKIASCSFTDWPLLERATQTDKPVIASTGGVKIEDIDKVVAFFNNREKVFALMHCVGQYPTKRENLEINQIDLLRGRYQDVNIGYSTHEEPDNYDTVRAVAGKNVNIFEKHAAVATEKYSINAYSVTPEQANEWLKAADDALKMCGVKGQRHTFTEKELADIHQFQRGAFLNRDIKAGESITLSDLFFAFPNQPGQLLANGMSKYNLMTAKQDMIKNGPLMEESVDQVQTREKVYEIVKKTAEILKQANVRITNKLEFEISHHYGIDKFYEWGAVIISCINREYCKKLIVLLPGQNHPVHYHARKEETFHVLYGEMILEIGGETKKCEAGDIVTVERGVKHSFKTDTGCVFEEVSTTHYKDDSFYEDEEVLKNKNRKTHLSYWLK